MAGDAVGEHALPVGLDPGAAADVVGLLETRSLEEAAERGGRGSAALDEIERLFALLDAYGVGDRVIFDA